MNITLIANDHQIEGRPPTVIRGTIWVDVNPIVDLARHLRADDGYVTTMTSTEDVYVHVKVPAGDVDDLAAELLRQRYGAQIDVDLDLTDIHQGDEHSLPRFTFAFTVQI